MDRNGRIKHPVKHLEILLKSGQQPAGNAIEVHTSTLEEPVQGGQKENNCKTPSGSTQPMPETSSWPCQTPRRERKSSQFPGFRGFTPKTAQNQAKHCASTRDARERCLYPRSTAPASAHPALTAFRLGSNANTSKLPNIGFPSKPNTFLDLPVGVSCLEIPDTSVGGETSQVNPDFGRYQPGTFQEVDSTMTPHPIEGYCWNSQVGRRLELLHHSPDELRVVVPQLVTAEVLELIEEDVLHLAVQVDGSLGPPSGWSEP